MESKVKKYVTENEMIEKGDKIVVAVSGGADSMCLLSVLFKMKDVLALSLEVVHVHHGIRGLEADRDFEFVKNAAKRMDLKFHGYKYDVPALAKKEGKSEEEKGREIRYECLYKVMSETNATKIAVAHNKNDAAETVLFSLFRGTGLKGLLGIPEKRKEIIRPLLCIERSEIEEYLEKNRIEYIYDSTNSSTDYSRNKIRNIILKEAIDINERSVEHIVNTANNLKDVEDYLEKETNKAFERCAKASESEPRVVIFVDEFEKEEKVIKLRIIYRALCLIAGRKKDIENKHVVGVFELFEGETGKRIDLIYGMVAFREYERIIIEKKRQKNQREEIDLEQKFSLEIIENKGVSISEKTYTKMFDYDKMKNGFEFRTRQDGDYIRLQNGRKKIKDYFIDLKIPRGEREKILLLAIGSEIVWIVGYRISEEYKVTEDTKNILKVEFLEA